MRERAVIYARYSSEKQTEQSIEGQLHVCKEYAEKNNLNIVGTYIDRAKTGKNDNREGFQQMLKDSSNKSFSVVLVYALDRFARNRYDSAMNRATLRKNGVKLVSATQPISENPEGILLESLLEGMAEYYSAELAQKVARGRRESVEKGQYIGGFVPYGYKIVNKKYVIEEKEAETVCLIFDLFIKLRNYKEVMSYLKANCILNKRHTDFKRHQLVSILSNNIYYGCLEIGEFKNENAVPVIINREKFEEAKEIMHNSTINHSKSPANFLLAGKVVCGECGANFIGESGTSKTGKIHYYYVCQKKKSQNDCILPRLPKEKFENYIYKKAQEQLTNGAFLNVLVESLQQIIEEHDAESKLKELRDDLRSIDAKLNHILAAVENGIINEKIKKQNDELLEKQTLIQLQIQQLENDPIKNLSPEQIKNFIIKKYAKAKREILLTALIRKIYVYKDRIIIVFNIRDENDPTKNKLVESEFEYKRCGRTCGTIFELLVSNNSISLSFTCEFNKNMLL